VHAPRPFPRSCAGFRTLRRVLLLSLAPCLLLLCHCTVWHAYKDIHELRKKIETEQARQPDASSLYHLQVAQGLLLDAEKQYEDADFTSALELTRQAGAQVDRSRKLRLLQEHLDSQPPGDAP